VVIATYSAGARERMAGLLADDVSGITEIARAGRSSSRQGRGERSAPGGVHVAVLELEAGFEAPGLTVIAEQDILGDRLIRAPKRRRRPQDVLTEAASLTLGDLVVHADHGIGRYTGLETITAMGAPHECLALEYAGGDKLYLPVENVELLSRYGHEEGLLDRLGGGAWQARKARLKARIREMAERLIRSRPSARCAPRRSSSRPSTTGTPSARAFPTPRPTTSSPRSRTCSATSRRAGRWTG
jgi:transcription-repair coupling factor (superfamily II helicase)